MVSHAELKPLPDAGKAVLRKALETFVEPYRTLVREHTPELLPLLPLTAADVVLAIDIQGDEPNRLAMFFFVKSGDEPETFLFDKDFAGFKTGEDGGWSLNVAVAAQLLAERYAKPRWNQLWNETNRQGLYSWSVWFHIDFDFQRPDHAFIRDVVSYIERTSSGYLQQQFGTDIDAIAKIITAHPLLHFPQLLRSYKQIIPPIISAPDELVALKDLMAASDTEEDFQKFLRDHTHLLSLMATSVQSKIKLGAEFITDFLIVEVGNVFNFVEIERPGIDLLTTKGTQAAELTHALEQIGQWRAWLAENPDYFRKKFPNYRPSREKFTLIAGRLPADLKSWQRIQDRERQARIDLVTYDEIIDRVSTAKSRLLGAIRGV